MNDKDFEDFSQWEDEQQEESNELYRRLENGEL